MIRWSQAQLAEAAEVGVVSVRQFEAEAVQPRRATLAAMRGALESAGVRFGPGDANDSGIWLSGD